MAGSQLSDRAPLPVGMELEVGPDGPAQHKRIDRFAARTRRIYG